MAGRAHGGGSSARGLRAVLVLAAVWGAVLATPVPASAVSAACTATERADSVEARRLVGLLRTTDRPGAVDAASVYSRAQSSCPDLRFARAVALAAYRLPAPTAGRRARVVGVDLIGSFEFGSAVWRLDVTRIAQRLSLVSNASAARSLRAQLRSAGSGSAAVTWSDDPTRVRWNAERQSAVASLLARSRARADRNLAGASVRTFDSTARLNQLGQLPLLQSLKITNRLALAAARSGDPLAVSTSRKAVLRAQVRVRSARVKGWSKIDGRWATASEHRTLVTQASALVAQVPYAATVGSVAALRNALTAQPRIAFSALPTHEFYPWPRDGTFDTQLVRIAIDKPASLVVTFFAPDTQPVRVLQLDVLPGTTSVVWDGNATDGSTLPAGEYRYTIVATDLVTNRLRLPGLESFRIARDTTAPAVDSASIRHVVSGGSRRLIASWRINEVHSPVVRSWVVLSQGEQRQSLQLHSSLQAATVRRASTLAPGTWRATFVFIDGSGNRTSHAAGNLVIR